MNFLNKLERKFGRYAISNLSLYLILCYGCGYLINMINPAFLSYLTLDPSMVIRGQVWRIVTWILVPPGTLDIFTLIMLYFYYSIGTSLERTWGTFLYNVYIFLGMIFTVLGSFLLLVYSIILEGGLMNYFGVPLVIGSDSYYTLMSMQFSTYYINMSIFLAFAATFPNVQVLLMYIIPIKVKWLGIVYAVLLVYEFINTWFVGKVAILASLLNFLVFFLMTRRGLGMRISPKQVKRRHDFQKEIQKAKPMSVAKHKCAICGRTGDEYPELEFRFCSKCNGNYEYCQEHLFTHTHVK